MSVIVTPAHLIRVIPQFVGIHAINRALIRASLLQILFSIRSERQLMEQMDYNLMFRWFVGLGIDDPVWVPTVFTKNRDRLLTTDMSRKLMAAILADREVAPLLSNEHFSVDGTLIKAWASMKSFQTKAEATPPDDEGPGDPPAPNTPLEPAPSETPAETDPMHDDSRRHRKDNGPGNIAVLRRRAIDVVRRDTSKTSLSLKLKRAG